MRARARSEAAVRRPKSKGRPRGRRGSADRLSVGAFALSFAIGLSLLAIVERALLEGGGFGTSGVAGAEGTLRPRGEKAAPTPRALPRQGRRPGAVRPGAPAPDQRALAAQVRRLVLARRGAAAWQSYGAAPARAPLVGTVRAARDRTWVLGTAAIPVPAASSAMPEVAFYAARWTRGRWQAALSGDGAFGALLARAPATVLSRDEAHALARYGAVTAQQAAAAVNGTRVGDGLMLPWRVGASWTLGASATGAPARPLGTLAFWGGDGRVLAAGDGRLYRFCGTSTGRALAMVIHRSGLATTYYGLRGTPELRDGSVVRRGDPLGRTGTGRPCGGAPAPRAQVGFALRRGDGQVPLDGARIGGWTFRERARPLLGYAERGALQVLPGGLLANLGPVPPADAPPSPPAPGAEPGGGARPGDSPAPSERPKRRPSAQPQQ